MRVLYNDAVFRRADFLRWAAENVIEANMLPDP